MTSLRIARSTNGMVPSISAKHRDAPGRSGIWRCRRLKEDETFRGVPISVDTFSSRVASEAVAGGADLVNDVSGGTMDPHMLATVRLYCGPPVIPQPDLH